MDDASNISWRKTEDIIKEFTAQFVRVRNTQTLNKWWRIADFTVDVFTPKYRLDSYKWWMAEGTPVADSGRYEMTLPQGTNIPTNGYLGMKLDRLHEASSITLEDAGETGLTLKCSANEVEWYRADELPEHTFVRYVRLVNKTG